MISLDFFRFSFSALSLFLGGGNGHTPRHILPWRVSYIVALTAPLSVMFAPVNLEA